MTAIASILAATDFSPPARHAAERAALLARESGARLTLLHVMQQRAFTDLRDLLGSDAAAIEQRLVDEARDSLARLSEALARTHGVQANVEVRIGSSIDETLRCADDVGAGLVVVGARGEGFLRQLLLGSTAERLLRKSMRPLLVVRQAGRDAYRRVLVPVDFSPWSDAALRVADAVAPQAELMVLHAFEVPFESKLQFAGVEEGALKGYRTASREEALRRLGETVDRAGLAPQRLRLLVRHGDASRTVLELEQEEDCELIVIGKHGKGALEELLLGSVTKHVLAQAAGDVLVTGLARGG